MIRATSVRLLWCVISTSRRDLFRFKHVEKVLLFSFSCMFLAFLDCKGFSEETHKLVMGKETGSRKLYMQYYKLSKLTRLRIMPSIDIPSGSSTAKNPVKRKNEVNNLTILRMGTFCCGRQNWRTF